MSPRRPTLAAGSTTSGSGIWASGSTGLQTTPTRSCAGASHEHGQHIELGIAEGNLVGLLGELGLDVVARRPSRCCRSGRSMTRSSTGRSSRGRSACMPAAVDPGRHPVRGDAGAGGRRAPVDHHAVGRARAAALHRVGAGLRPGPRVDAAARALGRLGRPDGCSAYFRLYDAADRSGARRGPGRPPRARRAAARFSRGGYRLRRSAAPRRRSRSSGSAR